LLFVDKSYHKRGIAKELLRIAITDIHETYSEAEEITINSSPYAVRIYERLGFIATDSMQEKDGIIYLPMKRFL
jgi:predicted GNAT family N-acyltransferase